MTSWQKRTRIGLLIFGGAVAMTVYLSIGERRSQAPPTPVERHDPKAQIETERGVFQQFRRGDQDFSFKSARSLSYADGSSKHFEIELTVQKTDGRSYVVTADEAHAGANQRTKQLTGHVRLKANDGFELTTDHATHSEDDGVVRAVGVVSFSKGGMTGSGSDGTFDQSADVLTIGQDASVTLKDEAGRPTTEFTSGSAVLDRLQNVLTLDRNAHVVRNTQVIDADRVVTRLSDDEQIVKYIELRGGSRVTGGGSLDSMSARDIDLDYTDDGRALERVVLVGEAGIAIPGTNGPGRQVTGDSLDVRLAPDGSIIGLTGRTQVRLDLPASGDSRAGSIRADTLEGSGEAGRGLTRAEFRDNVEYRETATRGTVDRIVRAQSLTASLSGDAVTDAAFQGRVTFDDEGVRAGAGDLRYQPRDNRIALRSAKNEGVPHVSLDQISIDASAIDVGLDDRRIDGSDVKTTLSPAPASPRGQSAGTGIALPGLLRQNEAARIDARSLEYRGSAGQAVYRGAATLWQDQTTIRADVISIDQEKGLLVATGAARSTLELDTGVSVGQAHEIRYEDRTRRVTYSAAPLAPTSEGATSTGTRGGAPLSGQSGRSAVPVRDAQLSGPQGDLQAGRIEIVLAAKGNQVDRLEAYSNVALKLGMRTASGGRLTYFAEDERYVMSGSGSTPVTIISRTTSSSGVISCRETTGRTLTFYKSTDTIDVDGKEQQRTESQIKPCTPTPAR